MDIIGRKTLNLYSLSSLLFLTISLILPSDASAFSRALSPAEVIKLEKNLKADPKNKSARRFLFGHYHRQKEWAKAVAVGLSGQADLSKNELLQLAHATLALNDGRGALAVISYYHSKYPSTGTSKYIEGMGYMLNAKLEPPSSQKAIATLAIGYFKEAIALAPESPEAYFGWLATLKEFWTQYHDDALQIYKQLEKNTGDGNTYVAEKCDLYVTGLLWEEALKTCQESINRYPEKMEPYARLATALQVKSDSEAALDILEKAEKKDPKSFEIQAAFGNYYSKLSNYALASKHYNNAALINPKNGPVFLDLALSEYALKKYPEALSAFYKNCYLTGKVAKEFVNAAGQIRANHAVHNKYKLAIGSCQEIKPR